MVNRNYYFNERRKKDNLSVALKRAGITLYWSFYDNAYKVESLYISKFSALGATEDEALELYGVETQESQSWRSIAEQFLGPVERFRDRLAFEKYIESNLENPISYWIELLIPLFEEAYQEPQNYEGALIDMPNWFNIDELRGWLLDSPFMVDSRQDMLKAFGVAGQSRS